MSERISYPTLEHVAMEARPYPAASLEGLETGLVLFAAAFLGHNDAIHFAEAGLVTTCVDTDEPRLREMEELYPDEWEFVAGDAWIFASLARGGGRQWDAVSVDTFSGDATRRSLGSLGLWTSLARRLVTVTITDAEIPLLAAEGIVPDGWAPWLVIRTKGVHWLALERGA